MSKRHGAVGIGAYRDMGYLPEALRNYLLRLGWSHGDDEIISTEQAIEWFNLESIGRSPARFDFAKLESLNGHYLRSASNERLVELISPRLEAVLGTAIDANGKTRLQRGMDGLKARAKSLADLAEGALLYVRSRPLAMDAKAAAVLTPEAKGALSGTVKILQDLAEWRAPALEQVDRQYAEQHAIKLGQLAQPKRAALTGSTTSPPIYEVMEILGKEETLARLRDAGIAV